MKITYRYIKFKKDEPDDHERWFCRNKKTDITLGQVEFYEPWRQWVIAFRPDCVFNDSCLKDIVHFLNQLNQLKRVVK